MNISSIGGASGTTAVGGANQNDFRTRMEQSMTPVAQLFGMTSDQLMSAVKASGKSLADYASSQGVSSTDLTAAVKQGLQSNAPNGVQLSDTQLTNLAQRIENHKPGDRPQGPPPGAAVGGATSTDSTSLDQVGGREAARRTEGVFNDLRGRVRHVVDDEDGSREADRRPEGRRLEVIGDRRGRHAGERFRVDERVDRCADPIRPATLSGSGTSHIGPGPMVSVGPGLSPPALPGTRLRRSSGTRTALPPRFARSRSR